MERPTNKGVVLLEWDFSWHKSTSLSLPRCWSPYLVLHGLQPTLQLIRPRPLIVTRRRLLPHRRQHRSQHRAPAAGRPQHCALGLQQQHVGTLRADLPPQGRAVGLQITVKL